MEKIDQLRKYGLYYYHDIVLQEQQTSACRPLCRLSRTTLTGPWCGSTQCLQTQKGDPKATLCRYKLMTDLEGALEVEAQTSAGRVTNSVAPDTDTQVAQTIV
jgi:hypothetical protein